MEDIRIARSYRNSFITGSFRDTADKDYIAARVLYRRNLTGQFLWQSLQAVEKYLKAILLYEDISTKKLGHDIGEALINVKDIVRLGFDVTPRAEEFIKYLGDQGPNRYFTFPRFADGDGLFDLDHTVWQVRRFCDDFFFPYDDDILLKYDQKRLLYVQGEKIHEAKAKFRLAHNGFLENVLDSGKQPILRADLVWKNFYFCGRNRKKVAYTQIGTCEQPYNFMRPEILDWAKDKVLLPREVEEEMKLRLRTKGDKARATANP